MVPSAAAAAAGAAMLDAQALRLGHGLKGLARRGQRGSGHRHRGQARRRYQRRGANKWRGQNSVPSVIARSSIKSGRRN